MAEIEEDEEMHTIAEDIVVTKYKMAGDLINDVLKRLLEKCISGARILDLCELGDRLIQEETAKVFKKEKEMKKGVAFPTCISRNNCICHFSPLRSDGCQPELADGDLVKIDLGAHIDGFAACVAHSFVIGASAAAPATGRKADAMLAAHYVAEACMRLLKPGGTNTEVADTAQKIASAYKCTMVENMQCHLAKQHVVEADKSVVWNPDETVKKAVEKCEFDVHEVWNVDVLVSTGDGKAKERDTKTTVFRKKETVYSLKMKASRQFFSEMNAKFQAYPFSLRSFEDENKARMGVVECVKHSLVEPLTVYWEKDAEFVAQFKFTLLLMPNGQMRITGLPFDTAAYKSDNKIEDAELLKVITGALNKKAQKKKAKKKAAGDLASAVESVKISG
ncbi:hypothetical protein BOX15_Mlig005768g1 [Macrostomum lignano]|uniref:Peptidase_M24 domain-containing protein n=3 Tax=Macrostomum lignano TaxID=282301 RepID=A0A1I8HA57_9PLAT|nr:hypothetical protein BOX15_Mlig005768g1 [Macrostomum lignano]